MWLTCLVYGYDSQFTCVPSAFPIRQPRLIVIRDHFAYANQRRSVASVSAMSHRLGKHFNQDGTREIEVSGFDLDRRLNEDKARQ